MVSFTEVRSGFTDKEFKMFCKKINCMRHIVIGNKTIGAIFILFIV